MLVVMTNSIDWNDRATIQLSGIASRAFSSFLDAPAAVRTL
jgi:hypothetical protein